MKVATCKSLTIILLALWLVSGCAGLPEYARPQFRPAAEGAIATPNAFVYRQLTPEDFQATSLPENFQHYDHSIQARSCISLRPARHTTIKITRGNIGNMQIYTGRYVDISFSALLNPDCSWWNPQIPAKHREYILEHEQIHFALTELSAQRLNRLHRHYLLDYIAVGNTVEEVRDELIDEAQKVVMQGMQEGLEMHTRFDEDTSMFYNQEKQREWLERIHRQLQEEEDKIKEKICAEGEILQAGTCVGQVR